MLSEISEAMTSLQKLMGLAQAIGPGYKEYWKAQNIRRWIGRRARRWGRQQPPQVEIGFQPTPNARYFMPPDNPEAAARRIAMTWAMLDRALWNWEESEGDIDTDHDSLDDNSDDKGGSSGNDADEDTDGASTDESA